MQKLWAHTIPQNDSPGICTVRRKPSRNFEKYESFELTRYIKPYWLREAFVWARLIRAKAKHLYRTRFLLLSSFGLFYYAQRQYFCAKHETFFHIYSQTLVTHRIIFLFLWNNIFFLQSFTLIASAQLSQDVNKCSSTQKDALTRILHHHAHAIIEAPFPRWSESDLHYRTHTLRYTISILRQCRSNKWFRTSNWHDTNSSQNAAHAWDFDWCSEWNAESFEVCRKTDNLNTIPSYTFVAWTFWRMGTLRIFEICHSWCRPAQKDAKSLEICHVWSQIPQREGSWQAYWEPWGLSWAGSRIAGASRIFVGLHSYTTVDA